jgi:dephospho-CoA kinase
MNKSLRIGVTGGIGAGKSLVCKIFVVLGIPVYDADSMAKKLMMTDKILIEQIKKHFGETSYRKDGSLNRDFLRQKVFNDSLELHQLNQLVHPRVAVDSEKWTEENENSPYTVKEAALLFESGAYKSLDKIIMVTAPESLRVQRVVRRAKSRNEEEVLKIIRSQMPEEEKTRRADFVIRNDETALVVPEVMKLHERFIACTNQ